MSQSYPYERWVAETQAERVALESARATLGDEADREIARGLRARGWSLVDVSVLFSWMLEMDVKPSDVATWELSP